MSFLSPKPRAPVHAATTLAPMIALLFACAMPQATPDSGTPGADGGATADAAAPEASVAAYPAGPYGNQIGDVIPNFTFQGFFAPSRTMGLASAETWGPVSMDQFRRTGAKFLVIELGAFW